jgi:hypothetical protein
MSERAVQFLIARETWFRSIMKADCAFETDSRVATRVKTVQLTECAFV